MAEINFGAKYADKIGQHYFTTSKIADALLDSNYITFDGVNSVTVVTPNTAPIVDYTRSGLHRYGTPEELGDTAQTFQLGYDKAFTGTFDKGNQQDSGAFEKSAANFLKRQQDEVITPFVDAVSLWRIAQQAGAGKFSSTALTKDNFLDALNDAQVHMYNTTRKDDGVTVLMGASAYGMLRNSPEYIRYENLGEDARKKGNVGEVFGMNVKKVPDFYLPTGIDFMCIEKSAAFACLRLNDAKAHQDPPGINGALMEGRFRFDAFVKAEKANGIYIYGNANNQLTKPVLSKSSGNVQISSAGTGSHCMYTVDGSDPRYSVSAKTYSGAFAADAGTLVRAVCMPDFIKNKTPDQYTSETMPKYPSEVAELTA